MRTWFVIPLLALFSLGCSSTLIPTRGDDTAATTEELKRRVLELQRQTTVHELEIERLQKRLAELEARSAPPPPAVAPPTAPIRRDIPLETVEPPSIDESDLEAVSLGKPDPQPSARTAPPPRAAPPRATPPRTAPPVVEDPSPKILEAPPTSAEEQQVYDRGYTLYHQGRYLDAEGEMRRFLQLYPNSGLADNAQYWIGESRYARKDIDGALAAFRETVERFPGGNKVPDALLKAGQCFEVLNDQNAARETYREVMERYPTSAAAARAEDRLETLE